MKYLYKILLSGLLILVLAKFLPGIEIKGIPPVLVFALVLALLNVFLKPILKIITFPITLFTLGLFLLVINVVVVKIADYLVDDFAITSLSTLFIFSIAMSVGQSIINLFFKD
ncbi:MAG: phage holin family protein [Flavobacterium sp.]